MSGLLRKNTRVCPWWFAYSFDNPLRRLAHDPEKILGPYLREGMKAIDLGCGMGYFSIAMARIVGDQGTVISVDIQKEMLTILQRRAEKAGVLDRIRPHLAKEDYLGITETVDFALAFWMSHEAPDARKFFSQVHAVLAKDGKLLLAEPRFHVTRSEFEEILSAAKDAGFKIAPAPPIRFSRSAMLIP
jgi:cyclopropane fatty-acyl-phospholipid synthase-like methyltransferase